MALSSRAAADAEFRIYRQWSEGGYLVRPPRESDNRVVRYLNTTFKPAPLRFGKTKVHCSLVAAIKHKNPLCLLNPIVLNISW